MDKLSIKISSSFTSPIKYHIIILEEKVSELNMSIYLQKLRWSKLLKRWWSMKKFFLSPELGYLLRVASQHLEGKMVYMQRSFNFKGRSLSLNLSSASSSLLSTLSHYGSGFNPSISFLSNLSLMKCTSWSMLVLLLFLRRKSTSLL